jgi:hypothetical protein
MDAPIQTQPIMDRIERDVREAVRRRAAEQEGASEYRDPAVFERVWSLLGHAADRHHRDFLLLPELLDQSQDCELRTRLTLTSHRPALGPFILLVKKRVLLPLTRWLLEYTRENFRRQQQVNRILFACIEELAIENARLRQALERSGAEETETARKGESGS